MCLLSLLPSCGSELYMPEEKQSPVGELESGFYDCVYTLDKSTGLSVIQPAAAANA